MPSHAHFRQQVPPQARLSGLRLAVAVSLGALGLAGCQRDATQPSLAGPLAENRSAAGSATQIIPAWPVRRQAPRYSLKRGRRRRRADELGRRFASLHL